MRIIFLLFLLVKGISCIAQEKYMPILSDRKVWNVKKIPQIGMGNEIAFTITLCGDTLVGDTKCHKLHFKGDDGSSYYKAAYEKDGILYYSFDGLSDGILAVAIDMNMSQGDVLSSGATVDVDTICVNGVARKRIKYHGYESYWVEGVGSTGMFWATNTPWLMSWTWKFVSCCENGKTIFTEADFHKKHETSIKEIDVKSTNKKEEIFDLAGRKALNQKRGCLYLMHGKKFIMQ